MVLLSLVIVNVLGGSADGACKHLAAALYELEAFEIKSCTEGENKWAKRPRHHDVPVPIRNLNIVRATYHQPGANRAMPYSVLYDPRPENLRQPISADSRKHFGLTLQEIAGDIFFSVQKRNPDPLLTTLT